MPPHDISNLKASRAFNDSEFTCLSSTTVTDKDELESWWGLRAFSHGDGYVTFEPEKGDVKRKVDMKENRKPVSDATDESRRKGCLSRGQEDTEGKDRLLVMEFLPRVGRPPPQSRVDASGIIAPRDCTLPV